MQELGLEWVHRLVQEPRKLAHRYIVDDLPFAALLFAKAAKNRLAKR
jgi:N-acetylglucosaminyldiphosphoundecaprenol N-acetyl-beta-D-mannosaminyltransferase